MSAPDVDIEELSFAYPDGTAALRGITFRIAPGERVAVLGQNGAGKSTMLLHLNGLLRGQGRVRVLGMPVERKFLREVRESVGFLFQNPDDQLFCPAVFDDVAFGLRNMGLAEDVVAARTARQFEELGLAGLEWKNAFQLSFGQRKRVSLATVLVMEPKILVLDEPTSNLDPRGRRELLEVLLALPQTQVVATHDLDFAQRLCGRGLVLSDGEVAADGPLHEILADTSLLNACGLM